MPFIVPLIILIRLIINAIEEPNGTSWWILNIIISLILGNCLGEFVVIPFFGLIGAFLNAISMASFVGFGDQISSFLFSVCCVGFAFLVHRLLFFPDFQKKMWQLLDK